MKFFLSLSLLASFSVSACPQDSQAVIKKHTLGAITSEYFSELENAGANKLSIQKMMQEGKVSKIAAGERICVIKREWQFYRAQVELGNGSKYWLKDDSISFE